MFIFQLQDNALTTLPKEVGHLQYLTRLNVSHNKLNQLPTEFFRLPKLIQLNLSHNVIVDLCPDISDLVMLEVLVSFYAITGSCL
jgi:Leucine-rich repeat (LRR) protein